MIFFGREFWARPARRALVSLFGVGAVLITGGIAYLHLAGGSARPEPIALMNAAARDDAPLILSPVSQDSPAPVVIEVDATRTVPADGGQLQAALESISHLTGSTTEPDNPLPITKPESVDAAVSWQTWARMQTDSALVRLPVLSSQEVVSVYSVHSREGATVVLCNRTKQKTPTLLRVTLPRGVYKIEKLAFEPPISIAIEAEPAMRPLAQCAPMGGAVARLERLESGDLANIGLIEKPIWLKPEQVCLIRYTDVAYAARAAFYDAREKAKTIRASAPTLAKRLSTIFKDGDAYLSGLNGGNSGSLSKRLNCIHRLLLLIAQAHSMHHNSQERKSVEIASGAALMETIERLNSALAETSAALLGLAPQISLEMEELPSVQNNADSHAIPLAASKTQEPSAAKCAVVTIALTNTGSRSVDLVKIGLDIAALPEEIHCEPGDPAMFGSLHPGQTARATFRLRWPVNTVLINRQCVGDVSYFVGSAPAHLRPRPW